MIVDFAQNLIFLLSCFLKKFLVSHTFNEFVSVSINKIFFNEFKRILVQWFDRIHFLVELVKLVVFANSISVSYRFRFRFKSM